MRSILFMIFLVISYASGIAQRSVLIEFGWDYPDVEQLSKNLPKMQNTPFDGICFSLQRTIMEAFDTTSQKSTYFKYNKLKNLQWGIYTDNFIILRGFGKSGGCWFNNHAWDIIDNNMEALSRAMASPGIKGVLFDPEYYYENPLYNPWTYSKKQYPAQSFEMVQAQIKKRGVQFIKALQKHKPDLSFLSIWIVSLIAEEKKYTPLVDTRHALLLPFIEGVLEGKGTAVKVIDGNEYAYWNNKPSQFLASRQFLKKNLLELMKSDKARAEAANIEIAQPIFYDGLLARSPSFEKGFSTAVKWKWLEENTKYAMASSDNITWFYSERVNWWQNKVNDTLFQILQKIKTHLNSSLPPHRKAAIIFDTMQVSNENLNESKGYYYFTNSKTPMKTGRMAFSYKWNPTTKNLGINFLKEIPATVTVFANKLVYSISPKNLSDIIKLNKFKKGRIIILAKYGDHLEASSIQVYK